MAKIPDEIKIKIQADTHDFVRAVNEATRQWEEAIRAFTEIVTTASNRLSEWQKTLPTEDDDDSDDGDLG